jgi:hypothetical protein
LLPGKGSDPGRMAGNIAGYDNDIRGWLAERLLQDIAELEAAQANHAGGLDTNCKGEWDRNGAAAKKRVDEIDAYGVLLKSNLPSGRLANFGLLVLKDLWPAGAVDANTMCHASIQFY